MCSLRQFRELSLSERDGTRLALRRVMSTESPRNRLAARLDEVLGEWVPDYTAVEHDDAELAQKLSDALGDLQARVHHGRGVGHRTRFLRLSLP